MKKICMIGHFATYKDMNDGQTVKTREIYNELTNNQNINILKIDTQNYKKRLFSFIYNIITCVKKNDYIILVVASGGAKILIPILIFLNKFYKKKICFCAVGSWFDIRVQKYRLLNLSAKRLDLILVETEELKKTLNSLGFDNVQKMYNFKTLNKMKSKNKHQENHFCTFSRVNKEKGIEDAIYAINSLNKEGYDLYLDIYGPIEKEYKNEFEIIMNEQDKHIKYKGNKDPNKSIEYISKYDILLFPTHYIKEGLPGTLLDSYSSSVPVIASNWLSAIEFVPDKVGYRYEFASKNDLKKILIVVLKNRLELEKKRNECRKFVNEFVPSKAIKPLIDFLNK